MCAIAGPMQRRHCTLSLALTFHEHSAELAISFFFVTHWMRIAVYTHSIAPSVDGVCRRFTSILHEMVRQGHEVLLFTLEDNPQELPIEVRVITIDHLCFPVYPDKKIARPTLRSLLRVFNALSQFRPQVVHAVADALSNTFLFCGYLLGIPVVGSFHTDIVALLRSGDAYGFQKFCIVLKEAIDSVSFDSCATTSKSFQRKLRGQYVHCDHVIITSVNNVMFSPKKRNQYVALFVRSLL